MSKRILVVEDDLLNRMFICATLESRGFAVQAVSDGAQVLESTKTFQPDLITMDINLPNVSGEVLIRKLKADPQLKEIPVVAITAHVGQAEERSIRRAGAEDYMAKPISIRPFLSTVHRLLEGTPAAAVAPDTSKTRTSA